MAKIFVIHGPNLNLLGQREPEIYGSLSMEDINQKVTDAAKEQNIEIECYQSNSEGVLIDRLQQANREADGVIFNPGGFTHTSVSLTRCHRRHQRAGGRGAPLQRVRPRGIPP